MLASAVITNKNNIRTASIKDKNSYRSSVSEDNRVVLINEFLPFRIRFTDIRVPGYGPNNVPPIGIQIIGYSNYIL